MNKLAKHISRKEKTEQEQFSTKLGFNQNHIENKLQEDDEDDAQSIILDMLDEFQELRGPGELVTRLIDFDRELERKGYAR